MFGVIFTIAPLVLAALAMPVMGERYGRYAKYLAFGASLATLAMAAYLFATGPAVTEHYAWFTLGSYVFSLSTTTQQLNMLLLMVVAVMTPLIFLYSMGYMETQSEHPRFYFEMCIFAASMLLFAMSASFITVFVAWEGLGVTSYLLIGFWYRRPQASTAARKAITTILIGDICMLIAIAMIGVHYGSFEFPALLGSSDTGYMALPLMLILVAAFTKSAQFPFHEWLSDAMEGPTPVSAFLHSSTMVKAGVFLIAVLLPLYAKAGLLPIILAVGLLSAAVGASNALTSRHIKKILAYSTIEDLALMFVALGLNALYAAVMLFFVQSFYKALLFMGAGSIMHANDDEEDIYRIYDSSSNRPVFYAMLFGVLSIAGIFPLSGFLGKAMLGSAASSPAVYAALVLIELAGSVYIFRWLFVPMRAQKEKDPDAYVNYESIPKAMVAPMYMLAALVVLAGLAYFYLPQYLAPAVAQVQQVTVVEFVVVNAVAIAGLAVANHVYRMGNRVYLASKYKVVYDLMYNTVLVNRAYLYVTSAFAAASSLVWGVDSAFDKATYSLCNSFIESARANKGIVDGQVNTYVLLFILGFVVLVAAFAL